MFCGGDTAPPGRKVVGPTPTSNPRFEHVHLLLGHVGLVYPVALSAPLVGVRVGIGLLGRERRLSQSARFVIGSWGCVMRCCCVGLVIWVGVLMTELMRWVSLSVRSLG